MRHDGGLTGEPPTKGPSTPVPPAGTYHPAIPNVAADARFERVTNLVTFLLHTRQPVSLLEIIEQVPGYPPGRVAYRRAFERDKSVLRDEGFPLTEENGRYRIRPADYYLPQLDLTPEERVALNLAVAAVRVSPDKGRAALRKLGGTELAGPVSEGPPALPAPVVDLPALPSLPLLHSAARSRAVVEFGYKGERRAVEPYGLLFREGHWYLAGRDVHRDGRRTFRVDRIEGSVDVGRAGAFEPPAKFEPGESLARQPWLVGGHEAVTAVVAVDGVLAGKVTAELGEEAVRAVGADGCTVFAFGVTNRSAFRGWLLGMRHHAEVLEPPDLRADVVAWLESMAAHTSSATSG